SFLEGVAAHAEAQPEDRLRAGIGVHEPALALGRGRDFDRRAMVPVRWSKRAESVNTLHQPCQCFTLPVNWFPLARQPILGVPALAIGLPWHLGIAADVFEFQLFR